MTVKQTLLTAGLAAVAAIALSACNTVSGFGQDLSSGGTALSNVAKKVEGKQQTAEQEKLAKKHKKHAPYDLDVS